MLSFLYFQSFIFSEKLQSKDSELQIVIIGKTGVGKSATGNTILRRKAFQSRILSSSVTQKCQKEKGELDGQNLAVVDTPGLFGSTKSDLSGLSDVEMQEKVMEEIKRCMSLASPGPVVFLVVLQLGRFTEEEQLIVKIMQRTFGREAAHYTIALFTRGDDLKTEGGSIEELIGANPALRDFIRECRGGYHVFDNRDTDPSQVIELLQKINSMVQRNGESSSQMGREGEGVLQRENLETKARKEAGRGNAFIKACLHGAFHGACTAGVVLGVILFVQRFEKNPKPAVVVGAVGGVVGKVAGAARYVACRLIWGSRQK